MALDVVQPDFLQKVDRCPEPDRTGDDRRAAFEFPRQFLPRRVVQFDKIDHFAAKFDRLHLLQQALLPYSDADAGRAAHFMAGKGVKVAIQVLNVDFHVRSALGAVHER